MKLNKKKKGKKIKPKAPKESYAAKSFVRNLNRSRGKDSVSLHPEKATKIFQINDLVDLRLIENKTYIYIDNKRFIQCFNVLLNVGIDKNKVNESIKNMDEAYRLFRGMYGQWFAKISPEEEFMAHCSNIQAFFENELNTDILQSGVAFPLLKKLVSLGYKPAENVFNKEIVKRFNKGMYETRQFLISEGYLKYLNRREKRELKEDKIHNEYPYYRVSGSDYRKLESILEEYDKIIQVKKLVPIRIFEYNDRMSEFNEVEKKYPLSTLLDSDKILLFNDPRRKKMWLWHGFNATTRMRYYAKKLAPGIREREEIGFKVISVDEGLEPTEFKIVISIKDEFEDKGVENGSEQLKPLSREDIHMLLKKFKELGTLPKKIEINGKAIDVREIRRRFFDSNITERQISPKDELDLFFILIEEGIAKIKYIMKQQSVEKLTIHRQYLLEIFSDDLLLISGLDGYPAFKPGVLKCFELKGIFTILEGQVIKFIKISLK